AMYGTPRLHLGAIAGRNESHFAKHCCGATALGHSVKFIYAELHSVFRKQPLVSPDFFPALARRGLGWHGLCPLALVGRASFLADDRALLCGPVRVLHVLSWRVGAVERSEERRVGKGGGSGETLG